MGMQQGNRREATGATDWGDQAQEPQQALYTREYHYPLAQVDQVLQTGLAGYRGQDASRGRQALGEVIGGCGYCWIGDQTCAILVGTSGAELAGIWSFALARLTLALRAQDFDLVLASDECTAGL